MLTLSQLALNPLKAFCCGCQDAYPRYEDVKVSPVKSASQGNVHQSGANDKDRFFLGNQSSGNRPGTHTDSKSVTQRPSKEGGFARHNLIISNKGRIDDVYTIESKSIGAGSYGSVKKAINKKTGAVCAVKSISKSSVDAEKIANEIEVMKILDHPNIIKLYETFEDAKDIYLVMELCTGGELFDRIVTQGNSGFSEKVAAKLVKQMVGALFYMHRSNIAHRDLKPENFVFADEQGISESPLKLIDFGASREFDSKGCMATCICTVEYVAPEVLKGAYTELCDVWSLGVIMYILLSGRQPFHAKKGKKRNQKDVEHQIRANVMKGAWDFNSPVWKHVSKEAKDLISKMLVPDLTKRWPMGQVMNHTWLQELRLNAVEVTLSYDAFNNLQAFQAANRLKKAACTVIAQHLSDAAIKDLREMFYALDKNGDGTISMEEMNQGIKKMGVEDAELTSLLNQIMRDVDSDGSGAIDFSEFLAAAIDEHHHIQEDVCWSAFRVFDVDGNGKITKDELAEILSGGQCKQLQEAFDVDRAEIENVVAEVDTDGDEKIDFDEFLSMMRNHEGHHDQNGSLANLAAPAGA